MTVGEAMMKRMALFTLKSGVTPSDLRRRHAVTGALSSSYRSPDAPDVRYVSVAASGGDAPAHLDLGPGRPPFDGLAETWLRDSSDPQGSFVDNSADLFGHPPALQFLAEEYATPTDQLQPRPAGHSGPPAVEFVSILWRRPGLSRDEFVQSYENGHAPLAMKLLSKNGTPLFAEYFRSFRLPDATLDAAEASDPALDFDVVTQMWFWTRGDFEMFLDQCADPRIGAELTKDEEGLFRRDRMAVFLCEEIRLD